MSSTITTFFLVSSLFVGILPFIFSLLMTRSFYLKRTVGTMYLYISFSALALAELLNSTATWIGGLTTSNTTVVYWLQVFYVNLYGLGIIYFYLFSTRHILRDNDVIKSIVAVMFAEGVAVITTLLIAELRGGTINFDGVAYFNLAGSDIPVITPSPIMLLAIFIPLFLITLIRIIFNLFRLSRKITDPVAKRGTQFIHISVISLAATLTLFILMQIPIINTYPALMIVLQVAKILTLFVLLFFGYLGWTLPDWLKKRIRGKAWIVQAFKKVEGKEIDIAYSSSANIKDSSKIPAMEVSDP